MGNCDVGRTAIDRIPASELEPGGRSPGVFKALGGSCTSKTPTGQRHNNRVFGARELLWEVFIEDCIEINPVSGEDN